MDPFLYDEFYRIERTHWWAVGMRGIFHALLGQALAGRERPRILDVGCGTGITLEEFGRYGSIAGVDLAWQALAYTRRRVRTARLVQADLASLPFGSSCVDAVLAFDVIEHLEDDRGALAEIRRILRPGGVALINVPAFASLWSGKDEANHHKRRYRRSALRQSLLEVGFTVDRITYTNAALFPAIWCARRIQRLARLRWNSQAEYHPSAWLNAALLRLLDAERSLLRHVDLPCGTSVTCVARRSG